MGKPKKSRKNTFNYDKNRKRAWRKLKKPTYIPCEPISNAWDSTKSTALNFKDMGLSADPNKTLPFVKSKGVMGKRETAQKQDGLKAVKSHVAEELEEQANQPRVRTLKFSDPTMQFCVYMMNKYGEDYKAMARDPKNYYQETPKQIRRKILTFKNIPTQYNAYLASLEAGCLTPLKKLSDTAQEFILPRRRMPTRGFEAGSRNGHFPSLSPVPATQAAPNSRKTDDSLLAAMVRVRRRLKFGRKPPRARSASIVEETQNGRPLVHELPVQSQPVSRLPDSHVMLEDRCALENTAGQTSSNNRLPSFGRKCMGTCSRALRSRRKLDMSDSGSMIKLEDSDCFRET